MNSHDPKSGKLSKKDPLLTPAMEQIWRQAVDCVRRAPDTGMGLEWETQVQMLLIILDIEITPIALNAAVTSALEGESLSWLISRIEHEQSKLL
jgi:hypothetical protein